MDELDLHLARAARLLISHKKVDLATELLSCRLKGPPRFRTSTPAAVPTMDVSIVCPRELYELLWDTHGFYTFPESYVKDSPSVAVSWALRYAHRQASAYPQALIVNINAEYGSANRSAAEQTELYMYVFGEDPVGQQVQVLDVGQHSAPTRQLIVSPVPVLPVTDLVRDAKLCFVAMPFAPQFRPVYDHAITKAVTDSGLTCRRGDDISQPGAILTQIWQSLLQARLVIADVSGGNGNVLYELGLAHVLGHEAILLTQNINDVPFDLRHQRTILYGSEGDGLKKLRASLTAAIQSSLAVKR